MISSKNILLLVPAFFAMSCRDARHKEMPADNNKEKIADSSIQHTAAGNISNDSIVLKETFNEEDIPANEYMLDRLKPIRDNFKRINSISSWTKIRLEDLWESTEGGTAKFYYNGNTLEKIVTKDFGETYQQLTEYYLLNGQLSFAFEKTYRYNRPMYYDSAAMKAANDTEAFSFDKSLIEETRNYFEKGKLLNQLNNQDCGAPDAASFLQEEEGRIKSRFEKLRKLVK